MLLECVNLNGLSFYSQILQIRCVAKLLLWMVEKAYTRKNILCTKGKLIINSSK